MSASLVTPDWLSLHARDSALRVVDCRFSLQDALAGQQSYGAGHLPGAVFLDLNRDLAASPGRGGRHPLPDPQVLAARLGQLGIGNHHQVICYDDSHGAFAARAWWLLRWLGHDAVALLDGGLKAWLTGGGQLSQEIPALAPVQFEARLRPEMVADLATIQNAQFGTKSVLVDSREPERYRGEQEPIDPIAGHIPGAMNLDWKTATDADQHWLSAEAQQQRWQVVGFATVRGAIAPAPEIIVYCGSGVTACVNLFSLELAGIEGAKLYPGSWSEWCQSPGAAIARGPEP
jgi:thiosulfate/3-mercaptopyruvate sulfurtransferase